MSSESQDFINDIKNVDAVYQGTFVPFTGATNPSINVALETFLNPSQSTPNLLDFNGFLATIQNLNDKTADGFITASDGNTNDVTSANCPINGLYKLYAYTIGINNPENTDLSSLISDPSFVTHFKALFADFLKNFDYNILTTDLLTTQITSKDGLDYFVTQAFNYQNFVTAYLRYLSVTAVVQDSSTIFGSQFAPAVNAQVDNFTNFMNPNFRTYVQSYKDIYEAFNGPINNAVDLNVFKNRLSAFYQSEVNKDGFFHTSQDLASWYVYNQKLYYNPQYVPNATEMNPRSTLVLNEILRLLIEMIGTVQNVAAAQANSLRFLSSWQASYTEKLNKIHTFTLGDGTVLGTFTTTLHNQGWDQNAAQQVRVALNNVNQSYITKLQANQQTISDQAKALQTNVNQSNDAANQQGSVADSVLQELATILSSIFR